MDARVKPAHDGCGARPREGETISVHAVASPGIELADARN
jgi:hypothetical protein